MERPADRELFDALKRGEFCYVLTSRQMGKSSLMNRTAARLREEGIRTVVLDLTAMGENLTAEQWYEGLLGVVGLRLDLEEELEAFWQAHDRLGPLRRWMRAIREVALPRLVESRELRVESADGSDSQLSTLNSQLGPRLVIFIDEIDTVRSLPFSTDEFFAAIRECYNRRSEDPELARLTFCLLGVATPSDLIQDPRTTPFNIGRRIELTDFTEAEAAPLAAGLLPAVIHEGHEDYKGSGPSSVRSPGHQVIRSSALKRVLYWTGGHPYLTQRLCRAIAEANAGDPESKTQNPKSTVDHLCEALFLSQRARERDDNLLFVRDRLLKSGADLTALLELYGQVRSGQRMAADNTSALIDLLRLSGIIRVEECASFRSSGRVPAKRVMVIRSSSHLAVRNRIYERVFDREWVASQMPDAELRRQRAAYRQGLLRATAVGGAVTIALLALALAATTQAQRASQASERADRNRQRAVQGELSAKQLAASLAETNQRLAQALAAAKSARAHARDDRDAALAARRLADRRAREAAAAARAQALAAAQAEEQQSRAQQLAAREHAARQWNERLLYDADLQLAASEWNSGRSPAQAVQDLLLAHRPHPGAPDRPDFAWRLQWRLLHPPGSVIRPPVDPVQLALTRQRELVTVDADRRLRVWSPAPHRLRRTIKLPWARSNDQIALSPDGVTAAAGGADGAVRVIDTSTGQLRRVLKACSAPIAFARFAAGGRKLICVDDQHAASVWDVATGAEQEAVARANNGFGPAGVLSPDGKWVASLATDFRRDIALIDWRQRGARESMLRSTPTSITTVAFSPTEPFLASAKWTMLQLWNLATRQVDQLPAAGVGQISSLVFSPDGKTLAAGGHSGLVALWDVASRKQRRLLKGPMGPVSLLAFSPDGKELAAAAQDGTVRTWEGVNQEAPGEARLLARSAGSRIACSPNGRWIAVGHYLDRRAGGPQPVSSPALLDMATGALVRVLRDPKGPVSFPNSVAWVAFSPDSRLLAGGAGDRVTLWETATGRVVRRFAGAASGRPTGSPAGPRSPQVDGLAISPDGRVLAGGFETGPPFHAEWKAQTILWELRTGRELRRLAGVHSPCFSPDGRWLATMSTDPSQQSTVQLWRMKDGKRLHTLPGPTLGALAFAPDGRTLAVGNIARLSGADQSAISLWDPLTGRLQRRLKAGGGIMALPGLMAFSPGGRILAAVGPDDTTHLWDVTTGREIRTLVNPITEFSLTFSPDGRRLIWCGARARAGWTIHVLEAATQPEITAELAREQAAKARLAAEARRAEAAQAPRQQFHAAERAANWVPVLRQYDRLTRTDPGRREYHLRRALALLGLGRQPEALAEYRRAGQFSPQPDHGREIGWLPALLAGRPAALRPGLWGQFFRTEWGERPPPPDERVLARMDRQLDYDWEYNSPAPAVPGHFQARWTGWLKAPVAGLYDLQVESDDGARLWLDGRQLIDAWVNRDLTPSDGLVDLAAGWHRLRVEYYEDQGPRAVSMRWIDPVRRRLEPVPASALAHDLAGER